MKRFVSPWAMSVAGAAIGAAVSLHSVEARACGCFAPPDPTVPIVQAGENIVFSHRDGKVVAHIQIQYQGAASEFGWILPLPSVPDMKLGTEELFAQILATTQPRYRLNRITPEECSFANQLQKRGAGAASDAGAAPNDDGESKIVVKQDSIGPFDYAVLKADSKDEMLAWLDEHGYFVPTGTEDVVGPYIRPNAYFLALRLRKGSDVGDIQPVVLEYESSDPMIPIILTQVAANPDMGIQVWVLGEHRAIPRNYRHTVLNLEHIDWFNAGANYNDVVIKAVDEAEEHQSFITEYAGTTSPMRDVLDYPNRFGTREALEALTDAVQYIQYLRYNGFPWTSSLIGALTRTFPMPEAVKAAGIEEQSFYANLDWYLGTYRRQYPEQFRDYDDTFDPKALTAELWERLVTPALEAGKLFKDNAKMTRLYTTLSPEEMTNDPVFSFNPDLPDVDSTTEATFTYLCSYLDNGISDTPGVLALPDGRHFYVESPAKWATRSLANVPYSSRIETLGLEGAPKVERDNTQHVSPSTDAPNAAACACRNGSESSASSGLGFAAIAAAFAALRIARRKSARLG